MNQQTTLVTIFKGKINGESQQLCNARDLHRVLQSQQDFSTWIKNRIEKYGFVENQDFCSIDNFAPQNYGAKNENDENRGGHNRIDYHITLDMAKELAMVERNEMGRRIRQYFIECEKQLRQQQIAKTASLPSNYLQLLQAQIRLTQKTTGLRYYEIYQQLNAFCQVSHYAQIPVEKFHLALDFLLKMKGTFSTQSALPFNYSDYLARQQVRLALKAFAEKYAVPLWVIRQDMFNYFNLQTNQDINATNANQILQWLQQTG